MLEPGRSGGGWSGRSDRSSVAHLLGRGGAALHDPHRLPRDRLLEDVAHEAAVAEADRPRRRHQRPQPGGDVGGDGEPRLLRDQVEDRDQLVGVVVGEGERLGEPRRQPGVGLEEPLHLSRVAGHDHHHLVAVVLHQLEQRGHRLVPEVAARVGRDQRVGLVDEQHAAGGLVELRGGARRGLADVLADQVGAGDLDEVTVGEHLELGVDAGKGSVRRVLTPQWPRGASVGDVVGRGVEAAAIMAQLRTAVRAYAADGHPPAAVVDRVNSMMQSLGPLAMTTLVFLVLDPAEQTLEIVSAGHPPRSSSIRPGRRRICGCREGSRWAPRRRPSTTRRRSPCRPDPWCCSTPTGSSSAGGSRSTTASSGCVRWSRARTTSRPLRGDRRDAGPRGAGRRRGVHRRARPPTLRPAVDALGRQAGSLAPIRYLLRRWLLERGATEDEAFDIIAASQEACANAIEHAYGPGGAEFDSTRPMRTAG